MPIRETLRFAAEPYTTVLDDRRACGGHSGGGIADIAVQLLLELRVAAKPAAAPEPPMAGIGMNGACGGCVEALTFGVAGLSVEPARTVGLRR